MTFKFDNREKTCEEAVQHCFDIPNGLLYATRQYGSDTYDVKIYILGDNGLSVEQVDALVGVLKEAIK